jgi:hypothetical protein
MKALSAFLKAGGTADFWYSADNRYTCLLEEAGPGGALHNANGSGRTLEAAFKDGLHRLRENSE